MSRKEAVTDLWVARLLDEAGVDYHPQGSDIKELDKALSTASKSGTGNAGYPEYVFISEDFAVVVEDKASLDNHVKLNNDGILDMSVPAIRNNAINGAVHYAMCIAKNSPFKKTFAIGVSGNERIHRITPLYVDDRGGYKELDDLESFISFSKENVYEYYVRNVLEEATDVERTTEQILKDAAELHEYLRTYGSLKDQDKPLVVSGILLALDEIEHGGFSIDSLKGDNVNTDGKKIYEAIRNRLQRSAVGPDVKHDKLMAEFAIIHTSARLNETDARLGKTPLKFYTEFLYDRIFRSIKYQSTSEDFIGRFYGEFMSYSGGDGQTLGIVLTPKHICDLFCDLLEVGPEDVVLDPCCGTAGFLIAAMHSMLAQEDNASKREAIKKSLHGFEIQSNMFAIACTNMILRKDGNSNLECVDFLKQKPAKTQLKGATIGMMNPPYSQGTKDDPDQYEISFVEHLLDSLVVGGRAAVIVPQSAMTGKSKVEQAFKANILKHHTLEGVITCNPETFYRVGVNPVIAVFKAHQPHPADKVCKFIDFRDDGYRVHAHIGLVEEDDAKDKRAHLLDVWRGNMKAPTAFCVESTVEPPTAPFGKGHEGDEWLHSFYYFNDAIPTEDDFEKVISEYLTFELSMVMQERGYLFANEDHQLTHRDILGLDEVEWDRFHPFGKTGFLEIATTSSSIDGIRLIDGDDDVVPYVTRSDKNNGISRFVSTRNYVFGSDAGGCITVGLDTQTAFWQPTRFVTGQNVQVITGDVLNKYVAMFLLPLFVTQMRAKFNWGGNGATLGRMRKLEMVLPVGSDGDPDWAYMEQYAMNTMKRKYEQYLNYLGKQEAAQ